MDASTPDLKELNLPRTRSRVGDFLFCAFAGILTIIGAMILGNLSTGAGALIAVMYFLTIGLRYHTLRDAVPVRAGVNVTEQQLETLGRLRTVLNSLPQPVMMLSDDSTVEMSNPAADTMFGGDVIGRHVSGLVRNPAALDVLRRARQTMDAEEVEIVSSGEFERTTLFYVAPLPQEPGETDVRLIVMLRDRTAQKKLERMRSDFIANASHELRTPLTSMGGFIETLQGHAKDDPDARERFLRIMEGQTDRMLRLVEDLIGLSSIEINEATVPEDCVDLSLLIRSVSETLLPQVTRQGADLEFVSPSDEAGPALVAGDHHELFRLVQNLCDNGLKYGGLDGRPARVVVSLGRGAPPMRDPADRSGVSASQIASRAGVAPEDLVWISIRDFGDGIQSNDLPRLTERFYRVNPEVSRSKGGTGLGLAIVKHILQRHRGGLIVESVPGEGAAFTCVFPPFQESVT